MGKLICLVGKSASGKSTLEKLLESKGFIRIVSTTTRPMREGEVEGIDYHFVTQDEFLDNLKNGNLLERTLYREWFYGIDKVYNNINLDKNNYVVVIEPTGYQQLVNAIGKHNIICFYVWVNDKVRLLRSLKREENPDCWEICRRFISDNELFKDFGNKADYSLENVDILETTWKIMSIIESIM